MSKRVSAEQRVIEYFRNESLERAETLLEIIKFEVKSRQSVIKKAEEVTNRYVKKGKEAKKTENVGEPGQWANAKVELEDSFPQKEPKAKEFEAVPV